MPTYEYRCPKGHEFELFQRMSDEPRARCPECGALSERLLSGGAGFLFKGEGFYATDYRSESYKKDASKEKETPTTDSAPPAKESAAASSDSAGKKDGVDSPSPSSSGATGKEDG